MNDEQAIRKLVETWMAASASGDVATVLGLMSDDVVFMVPGKEPFGKEAFAQASEAMKGMRIEGESDIRELKILSDWAWMRNRLKVTMTMPDGTSTHRSGYTLTVLKKRPDGAWVIHRDANLLTTEA